MSIQTTIGTGVAHLLRPEDALREAQKQCDANDHDKDGEEAPQISSEDDVAETSGGQCGNCEVQGIDKAVDVWVVAKLQNINERGHQENKHAEVDGAHDDILVPSEERRIATQIAQDVIGMEQSECPQHPQKGEVERKEWRQKNREYDQQIGDRIKLSQHSEFIWCDP